MYTHNLIINSKCLFKNNVEHSFEFDIRDITLFLIKFIYNKLHPLTKLTILL